MKVKILHRKYAILRKLFGEREKRIKRWRRQWKIELIESVNPTWRDMALEIPL